VAFPNTIELCIEKESPNRSAKGRATTNTVPMFVNCIGGVQIDMPVLPPWR
jgi:hypothetical protein